MIHPDDAPFSVVSEMFAWPFCKHSVIWWIRKAVSSVLLSIDLNVWDVCVWIFPPHCLSNKNVNGHSVE